MFCGYDSCTRSAHHHRKLYPTGVIATGPVRLEMHLTLVLTAASRSGPSHGRCMYASHLDPVRWRCHQMLDPEAIHFLIAFYITAAAAGRLAYCFGRC